MKRILLSLCCPVLLLSSCIHHELEPCENGSVAIRVYVERFGDEAAFQTRADIRENSEALFTSRVKHFDYYLYKDGELIESGPAANIEREAGPAYTLHLDNLQWGEYQIALMANCVEDIITGDFTSLDEINVNYPGIDDTDDYFLSVFPFTVGDNGSHTYDMQLKRLHGVVRYTFTNVDPAIKVIEVTMDGLTSSGCFAGTYANDFNYTKRIVLDQTQGGTRAAGDPEPSIVATFPTMAEGRSAWSIKLYNDEGDVAFYDRVISDDVEVVRNRLLDLTAVLEKNDYRFIIKVNTDWNGGNEQVTVIQ